MAKKRVPSAPVAYTEADRRNGLAGEDVDIIKIKSGALHMPRLMMSDQQGCRKTENGEWKKNGSQRERVLFRLAPSLTQAQLQLTSTSTVTSSLFLSQLNTQTNAHLF